MTDEPENIAEGGPIELSTSSSLQATGSVISGNVTVGDQTVLFAEAEIRVATAAHEREIERERVKRELEKDKRLEDEEFKDRHWQRVRENCTYAVVVSLIVLALVGCFYVAVTSKDPGLQAWAQDLTGIIAGVVGGGFAGYLIGGKK